MLETNIRVVRPGTGLRILVRRMVVRGQNLDPDLVERACSFLRRQRGLAAAKIPGVDGDLLVATNQPLAPVNLRGENWELNGTDAGEPSRYVSLADPIGQAVVPVLVERALLAEIARRTDWWTLDSPRVWYEARPFECMEGIAAVRRYEIGTVEIEGVGVGVAVDVGTAFFTEQTLDYFFGPSVPRTERIARERVFAVLTGRQQGQKGTLLYDNGRSRVKCYFEEAPAGLTVGTTGALTVRGKKYKSLYDYYRLEYPGLHVPEDAAAVRVSFPGIDRPQPVAARLLRVRVMSKNVPEGLARIDKLAPDQRKGLIERFWEQLGSHPLGRVAPGLAEGFWYPDKSRVYRFPLPDVCFANGRSVKSPLAGTTAEVQSYQSYYRRRLDLLQKGFCHHLPPTAPRTIYCAYPESVDEEAAARLADDLVAALARWTGRPFKSILIRYRTLAEACRRLRSDAPAVVLFVLDDEPAAYYDAAFNLPDWRVKRVTEPVLQAHYGYLTRGMWNGKLQQCSLKKGQRRWDGFVVFNALAVLQLLDAVPYRIGQAGNYEAQLAIDVGHDRRFFAVSLLIVRSQDKRPSFRIYSRAYHKQDHRRDSINPVLLKDAVVELFRETMGKRYDPVASLLVLRDGRVYSEELTAIDDAVRLLMELGILGSDAHVDLVGVHKQTLKAIRLWETDQIGGVKNPLEGTGVLLSQRVFVLACTGAATLTQGTVVPLLLVADGKCHDLVDAAYSVLVSAQLNWSSPAVAQRLPLPLKRTDEELTARAAQEVRRIR